MLGWKWIGLFAGKCLGGSGLDCLLRSAWVESGLDCLCLLGSAWVEVCLVGRDWLKVD